MAAGGGGGVNPFLSDSEEDEPGGGRHGGGSSSSTEPAEPRREEPGSPEEPPGPRAAGAPGDGGGAGAGAGSGSGSGSGPGSAVEPPRVSMDAMAAQLLRDQFLLTALELHTELLESGRELPRLRDFFSNPGNFERQSGTPPGASGGLPGSLLGAAGGREPGPGQLSKCRGDGAGAEAALGSACPPGHPLAKRSGRAAW